MSLPTVSPNCPPYPGRKSATKETSRRRKTDTEHDKPSTVKQQCTTDTQLHRAAEVKGDGHGFETHLAAFIGLRGLHRGDNFVLFTNRDDAGNFVELVYTAGGRRYFLQLKHDGSPEKEKLTKEDLVELLLTCISSYCHIKYGQDFRDIPVDKTEFIIYTNRKLDPELSQNTRKQMRGDVFFETLDNEIFMFIPDKIKETDVCTILENVVEGNTEIHGSSGREIVSEFLNKVKLVTSVKGKCQLDDEIRLEIKEQDAKMKVSRKTYTAELLHFKTGVETWLKKRNESVTAEMFRNWLQEAKTKACRASVRTWFVGCTKELVKTGINFADSELSRLQAELFDKPAVHLRSDAPAICSILLMQCLPVSKCIFVNLKSLKRDRSKLLHAWLGGDWQWCVVFCDTESREIHISDTCLSTFSIMKPMASDKCVIILTPFSVQQIQGFSPIDHKFQFEHLSQESQKMVLDRKVDFQGHKLTVKNILHQHGIVEHALGSLGADMVSGLVTKGTIQLGGRLHTNRGYYKPRVLEREVWLQLDVLRNRYSYPDMFVVNGVEVKDLCAIVPAGKTVEYIDQQNIHHIDFTQDTSSRFIERVLSEADEKMCFRKLCKKHKGRTLHWVQFKNGNLLWKKTHGDPDKLLTYIDTERTRLDKMCIEKYLRRGTCEVSEKAIWDLGERTVLVVAEPGMGKSSTTTQVASHTKSADPTSWIVHINWNDHCRKLQEINAETFNFDSLVEFLCSAAFSKSVFSYTENILLKQALQNSGNVTVLMDGFDEISPIHVHKATVILSELMKTKVRRVWITSRPVEKERLERKLSVTAWSMKKLSHLPQLQIFQKLSMSKEIRKKEKCAASINERLNHKVNDSNFTDSPLYDKMIFTGVELDTCVWLRLGFSKLRRDIDLVCLYDNFFERKLPIYLAEVKWLDITNDIALDSQERLKEGFLEEFEKCALVATMPPSMLKSLHNKKTEEEIQPFLGKVRAGKDKMSIVMYVVDGKPKFVHSFLAEYLTSRWLSKNFEFNRSVLERILFDPEYSFVRDMFDRILAKDCPLHCAALERDEETFETLLERCDISAVDKGGRTVMHIIATRHCTFLDVINRVFPNEISLHIADYVLHWTPLQYAIKSEKWFIVERLLQSNVDRSGLDMIRQRAQDPDYINPIIMHAATYGHVSLLEFLCSIGVSIHEASSRGFPTPLHAAVQGEQLEVIRWLIKHGADCNIRYSDGKTPLFHAVTETSLDVVRALVEEGGASVDVRDDDGRTAIDWMNDYASDPNNCDDIVWTGDLERLNEIVKYLQERGVESAAIYG